MFYLRSEAHESTIPEMKKTDGTVIPERKYMVEERAIYKHKELSRFYRNPYPISRDNELILYKTDSLEEILELRESMFEYCGEWFDVYDNGGKVSLSQ